MTDTMRATRFYGQKDLRIDRIPRPTMKPGHIRIAPAFCGICGTDLHEYMGEPNFTPTSSHPHPLTGESPPIGFGHEFSGRILELAPDVSQQLDPDGTIWPVGAKCTVQPNLYCGSCGACRTGAINACPTGGFIGLSGWGGGLADEVLVPARQVFPVPEVIPLDVAALVEPLSVGWHAVDTSGIRDVIAADEKASLAALPTSSATATSEPNATLGVIDKKATNQATALVLGGGPIGLAITQCLRAVGVGQIIVSEVSTQRARFAADMGAHYVLDPRTTDVLAETRRLTATKGGADVVFDCAGFESTIKLACHAIRSRGTVVNVAIWEQPVAFNPTWLVLNEGRYLGVLAYHESDYRAVIAALEAGRIVGDQMITARIAMHDVIDKGFRALLESKDQHVKILVDLSMK